MKCQVCGAESGKYPLCCRCNELKEQGIVIKCPQCHTWHRKDGPCSAAVNPIISLSTDRQSTKEAAFNTNQRSNTVVSGVNAENSFLYAAKHSLMSKIEIEFYNAIALSIPQGFRVYPQINLATFIRRTDGARFQNELYRNIDFLITDQYYTPRIAVEINDRTHLDWKRQERDRKVHNILEEAGVPLLTLWISYGVNREYIAGRIQELLNAPVRRIHHFDLDHKSGPVNFPDTGKSSQSSYSTESTEKKQGCYIATCVYGSYDCAPVWTLRRFRDDTLSQTWYGRGGIKLYYTVSPTLVKWFGNMPRVRFVWKTVLDKFVKKLNQAGYEDSPYYDN